MTKAQICDAVTPKIDALISQYNQATWQGPSGGEMAGGLLYLMKGSVSYWKSRDTMTTTSNPNPDGIQGLFTSDCVGYLTGWVSALWDDAHSAGGVKPAGQWRRIGQGVIWGVGGSAAGWLVSAHQLGIDYH
jgi:hypothetical protein